MIKKIVLITLVSSFVFAILSYLIFKDTSISLGILIGSIARLAGLRSIVNMSKQIEYNQHPDKKGTQNYMIRCIFYGVVIWICITRGINIIGLLLGFMLMNGAIMLIAMKKEDE
ncbi:MAG: ATP synthase subunit I [Erysipelotrichaceae bacterium]